MPDRSPDALHAENDRLHAQLEELRLRLDEAEQAIEAIRTGQAESLIVEGPNGPRVFSLEGADHSYRVLVEAMNEGAATLSEDGTILYCNARLAEMLDAPLERVMGRSIEHFLPDHCREGFSALIREANGRESRAEMELLGSGGQTVPAYLSLSTIQDGPSRRFCVVAADLRAQKRHEEILAAERFARAVIEQAADAILVCDERGRVIRASSAATGLCEGNPLLAPFDEAFPLKLEVLETHSEGGVARRALRGERLRTIPARLERSNGSNIHLVVSAAPLTMSADRILGCIISMTDITQRKRAEDELRASEERALGQLAEIEAIYRSAGVGLCVLDRELRHVRVNDRLAEIDGISVEAHLGRTLREVVPDLFAKVEGIALRVLRTGQPVTDIEITGATAAQPGVKRTWIEHWLPLKNAEGVTIGINVVTEEITERKKNEEALSAANVRLAEADRQKNEFLAILSHELRNPLAPIRNSLRVLDRVAPESEQALAAKAIIDRQVEHLVRLVDDLLDVTRITRNKIQIERKRFELTELLRRTVEDQRYAFATSGAEIEVRMTDGPIWVNADPARIGQIVWNLLQNAVKFTGKDGRVTLGLEKDAALRLAVIRVCDTGIGISPEVLPLLFQPFMQAESTLDRSRGGLGLGLAIVKGLVDLHGGTVEAHSDGLGKGAEFTIRLPLDQDATISASQASESPTCPGRRVLIIEDHADAARSLRMLLAMEGHNVAVAHDGSKGIATAVQFHPEIVLCDIGLPDMSGYQVARAFRSDPRLKDTFLVALTGYGLPEDIRSTADAGFACHLTKPPTIEQLLQVLASAPPLKAGAGTSLPRDSDRR